MIAAKSRQILILPFLLATLGAVFCAWNSLDPASVPCITEGCTLFQTFTVGGLSLWWGGVVIFLLLIPLALMGAAIMGWLLSGLALGIDCFLLVIMALTAPCFSCLITAVLLALCFWRFREDMHTQVNGNRSHRESSRSWLLPLWGLLLVINLGLSMRSGVAPWAVQLPQDDAPTRVSIYFSPTCGACRQLVLGMPPGEAAQVAWYPVIEDGQSLFAVDIMHKAILEGVPLDRAFSATQEMPTPGWWTVLTNPRLLVLQFRLWVNQAHVLRAGNGTLPYIEFRGLPEALLKSGRPAPVQPPGGRPAPSSGVNGMTPRTGSSLETDLPFLNLQSIGECTDGRTTSGAPCP